MAWVIVVLTVLVMVAVAIRAAIKLHRIRRRAFLADQMLSAVCDAQLRMERGINERAARMTLRGDTFVMVKGGNREP